LRGSGAVRAGRQEDGLARVVLEVQVVLRVDVGSDQRLARAVHDVAVAAAQRLEVRADVTVAVRGLTDRLAVRGEEDVGLIVRVALGDLILRLEEHVPGRGRPHEMGVARGVR
jgi:hypothetical protein